MREYVKQFHGYYNTVNDMCRIRTSPNIFQIRIGFPARARLKTLICIVVCRWMGASEKSANISSEESECPYHTSSNTHLMQYWEFGHTDAPILSVFHLLTSDHISFYRIKLYNYSILIAYSYCSIQLSSISTEQFTSTSLSKINSTRHKKGVRWALMNHDAPNY